MTPAGFDAWVTAVRSKGIALNEHSLRTIAQRNTRDELIAALSQHGSPDGDLYFTGATAAVFPAVVMATMGDAMPAPDPGTTADLAARKPAASATETMP